MRQAPYIEVCQDAYVFQGIVGPRTVEGYPRLRTYFLNKHTLQRNDISLPKERNNLGYRLCTTRLQLVDSYSKSSYRTDAIYNAALSSETSGPASAAPRSIWGRSSFQTAHSGLMCENIHRAVADQPKTDGNLKCAGDALGQRRGERCSANSRVSCSMLVVVSRTLSVHVSFVPWAFGITTLGLKATGEPDKAMARDISRSGGQDKISGLCKSSRTLRRCLRRF